MDLSDFSKVTAAAEEGAILEVKDPIGDPILQPGGKPVTITLAGMESNKFRKARNVIGNRYLKQSGGARYPFAQTTEAAIDDQAFQLASVTLSWEGIVDEGQPIECNAVNAKRLYIKYDFLRRQVDEFVGEQRNFWKASSTS